MEYGVGVFLPPFRVLQRMAEMVVRGDLSLQRSMIEERYEQLDSAGAQRFWRDWRTDTEKWTSLDLEAEIDHTRHLGWWITARVARGDGLCYSGSYMAPDFALAWLIAREWEYHQEWLEEQLEVVGGTA